MLAGSGAEAELLGTGAILSPGVVLTARHIVLEKGRRVRDLHVRPEGAPKDVPVTGAWWFKPPGHDVAVLAAAVGEAEDRDPLAVLRASSIDANDPFETLGFPVVRRSSPSSALWKGVGRTCSCDGEATLQLDPESRPKHWNGLSGAPVILGRAPHGKICGVVRAGAKGWRGGKLMATPVSAFSQDPEFLKALGLGARDAKARETLARIQKEIVDLLQADTAAAGALARQLPAAPAGGWTPQALAHAVVHTGATDLAERVNKAQHALGRGAPSPVATLGKVLWTALPYCIDWRSVVFEADTPGPGPAPLELNVSTATVAELVLAGVDVRPCAFVLPPAGGPPVGRGMMRLPPAVPMFDVDGRRGVDRIAEHLWSSLFRDDPVPSGDDARTADFKAKLRYHAVRADPDEKWTCYLLFDDATEAAGASEGGAEELDRRWRDLATLVANDLPHLRPVRLRGLGNREAETELGLVVRAVCRKTGGSPT